MSGPPRWRMDRPVTRSFVACVCIGGAIGAILGAAIAYLVSSWMLGLPL